MTTLLNLFHSLDKNNDKKENKLSQNFRNNLTVSLKQGDKYNFYQSKITDNLINKINYVNSKEGLSSSLEQGKKFRKYQNKITTSLDKSKEGFQDNTSLTKETKQVLKKTVPLVIRENQEPYYKLKEKYQTLLSQYSELLEKINGTTTDYIDRISPSNPYLNKNISFTTGEICYVTNQGVVKWYQTKDMLKSLSGKNGCPISSEITAINLPWLPEYNTAGTTIPTKPSLITGTPMQTGQSCGNEGQNIYVSSMIPENTSASYLGCYADNTSSPAMSFIGGSPNQSTDSSSSGSFTYTTCKQSAINSGSQYFALQKIDPSTGLGFCAISNNEANSTQYGLSTVPNQLIPLWSSNTQGQTGNTALLSNIGALSVINSSGGAIFNTPNSTAQPGNYLGCYGDGPNRAMMLYNNGAQQYNLQQCQQIAQQNNYSYFALQNSTSGTTAQCALSNDFAQTSEYGVAGNCTKINDGSYTGGAWSNAVYNNSVPNSNYFLILQDDGNMCIYRGTGPNDNQGAIWCSMTNGMQQQANPSYVASKGINGKNWISSGTSLAAGDFIGSTSGNMALIMQPDGNLVLYTFQMVPNCTKISNNNKYGGNQDANAIYKLSNVGQQSNMGNVAYVDGNSTLYSYPSQNIVLGNTYNKIPNTDSPGSDISGAAFDNATVDSCQTACNSNQNCYGFAFSNNTCYPKTKTMYPSGNINITPNFDLYIREKSIISPPIGISNNITNTNAVQYSNYVNSGKLVGDSYGLKNATTAEQQRLQKLQTQMTEIAHQMMTFTNLFNSGDLKIDTQSKNNMVGLGQYVKELKLTNDKVQNFNTTIDNILSNSDITVLQKNYNYMFWSILAIGAVIITINVSKK